MSTPLSIIEFYKAPALSPTYRDSYYFNDMTAQESFFQGLPHKTLNNSQVTRISNNQVKVPYPSYEMLTYNYMMIQNARTYDQNAPKKFYCFITNVEYVSDLCSLITFEVDVIQTYIVSATIREAFVERCHTDTDNMFENREPEPFTVQNYTVDKQGVQTIHCKAVIGIVNGQQYEEFVGTPDVAVGGTYLSNGVFSGAEMKVYDLSSSTDMARLEQIITSLKAFPESITSFFVVPSSAFNNSQGTGTIYDALGGHTDIQLTSFKPTSTTPLSGYVPKNKKLYNYPFTKLVVVASNGQEMELLFEEFPSGSEPKFRERGSWYGGGEAVLHPLNYSMVTSGQTDEENLSLGVSINDFPKCSWSGDSYKEWENQKLLGRMTDTALSGLGNVLTGVLISSTLSPTIGGLQLAHGIGNIISDISNTVSEGIEASKKPNKYFNSSQSSSLAIAQNKLGWYFLRVTLSKAEAEQIDNYFTMFGYAQNKIMNVRTYLDDSARPKFCYIKTKGFSVKGNIPSIYKDKFNAIFDNGITFWKTDATVGNYSGNIV